MNAIMEPMVGTQSAQRAVTMLEAFTNWVLSPSAAHSHV